MTERDNNVLRPDFAGRRPKHPRQHRIGRSAVHIYVQSSSSFEQKDWDPAYVSQVMLENGDLVAGVSFDGLRRLYRDMDMNTKLLGRLRKLCDKEPRAMIHRRLCYPDQATLQAGVCLLNPNVEGFVAAALREQVQINWLVGNLDPVTSSDFRQLSDLADLLSITRMPQ